jgi:acyl-CoA synthetase (NDP forming)
MTSKRGAGRLSRLMRPRSIAVIGGDAAQEVVRQSRAFGFDGAIWPVNSRRQNMDGIACFPTIEALPGSPDAVFLATPAEPSIKLAGELARARAGGAICYASDFAEAGPEGRDRQAELLRSARGMPIIGPNCYGMINAFDRVALWPDQHGCRPIDGGPDRAGRGIAIISQSGNLALNLTMQTRGLPLGYVISVGNCADTTPADLIEALLDDRRVSAIGLHLEALGSIARFSQACLAAREAGIPLVALKTGVSARGAALTLSHTGSLAGPDRLCDALFDRCGIARAHDPAAFLETLKILHVGGPLRGNSIASASCSGGEASLVADLAERFALQTPAFAPSTQAELEQLLGPLVAIANPLDYHTHIWGDGGAQTEVFAAMMSGGFDALLLLLDFPRADRCTDEGWRTTLDAFIAAHHATHAPLGTVRMVVSSLPENLPEAVAVELLAAGIVPVPGLSEAIGAIASSARMGEIWSRALPAPIPDLAPLEHQAPLVWDEFTSKAALSAAGVAIPAGRSFSRAALEAACSDSGAALGVRFPLVLKAVGSGLAHKTELRAVALGLTSRDELLSEVRRMADVSDSFLVEEMIDDAVAELIVGVACDPQFGPCIAIGAGGIFVELLRQVEYLLLPTDRAEIERALRRLPLFAVLAGYRGRVGCDLPALVDAIIAIARFAEEHSGNLNELDVNPLLALPYGAVAVDAIISMRECAPCPM